MQYRLPLFLVALIIQTSVAPPVTQKKDGDHKENEVDDMEDIGNEYQIEYQRYLKEVVQALESDAEFRAKLEKADEDDIRTGKIAHELQFVDHKIRTKLDELKREELERLRHLATKEHNLINGLDLDHLKIAEHMDHSNLHTFEIDDLKKLIAKTTKDLADADKRRRQQFKEYEMEKKFEEEQKMKDMKEEAKKKYEEELEAMKKKHKDHKPLHHPGSKQQLEEVWEKQDHMENQEFNPKTFFYLHDLDGNGFWDQDEVKALFLKELDKLYSEGAPEDDIYERREEMERMREHVFNEADLNHDGLISYQEFLEQTKKPDFQQDEGWQGLDEQQMYSQEEYEAFQKRRQEEIQNMVAKGMLPPPPDTAHLPVQHEQFPPQYQQQLQSQQYHPQQIHPSQQQYSGQIPPQQPIGHVPQQYQGQVPQQQFYQPPPQQHYPDQIPQQHQYQVQQPQYQVPVPQQHFQAQPQYQQPQQAQQQFHGQPQQTQQQFQSQPQQTQQQFQGQPQQVQQQSQDQPQQGQQQTQQKTQQQTQQKTQQQTQNQVPQNTQGNAPTNNQGVAPPSHNLPQNPKSAEQQINQNNIPKVQKV
ncbi:nucleobindin-2-like isoform x1 protein [Lasius niger]|uniref:Nucleobindin-2-like isoform x1 protein n=1 Tax=Lasius niger TaxID=67767 RepID=A0A0J7NP67_LASNI|nr:nucleobindin-2-like isoform x1 protein [Lasius niger]